MAFIRLLFVAMNPSQSHQLQMQALREALERSARATYLAEEHTVRALSDLRVERGRVQSMEKEIFRLSDELTAVIAENRRLRNLVGQACQDRNSLTTDLQALLRELREPDPVSPTPGEAPIQFRRNVA